MAHSNQSRVGTFVWVSLCASINYAYKTCVNIVRFTLASTNTPEPRKQRKGGAMETKKPLTDVFGVW